MLLVKAAGPVDEWRREFGGAIRSEFLKHHPHVFLLWSPRLTPSAASQQLHYHTVAHVAQTRGQLPSVYGPPGDALLIPIAKTDLSTWDDPISVGRAPNCDIVFGDSSVSKLHGHFRSVTLDSAEFTDARSVNGTRVEGLLIPSGSSVVVRPRSYLSFGRIRVQVLSPIDVYEFL